MYYRAYQKLLGVLLCEDDGGASEGKGTPALRAGFADCVLMQSTGLEDKNGKDIFEGDVVRVSCGGRVFEDTVPDVPDMFRSRRLHPLDGLLKKHGLTGKEPGMEIEVIGNAFQPPAS